MKFKIEPLELSRKILKELALYISRFFDVHEISSICENIISVDFIRRRPIDKDNVCLYSNIVGAKSITVYDNLDLDHFPFRRWVEIVFDNSISIEHRIFYYNYNKKLYSYLTSAFAFAYNIKEYGGKIFLNSYDLYKHIILDDYSLRLYMFINKINPKNKEKLYNDLLTLAHSFEYDRNLMSPFYNKYFKILTLEDNITIECISISDLALKFQISNHLEKICIYINRNIIGITNLIMAIERAYIHYKTKNKHPEGE